MMKGGKQNSEVRGQKSEGQGLGAGGDGPITDYRFEIPEDYGFEISEGPWDLGIGNPREKRAHFGLKALLPKL